MRAAPLVHLAQFVGDECGNPQCFSCGKTPGQEALFQGLGGIGSSHKCQRL
jgi:hypothetical protein